MLTSNDPTALREDVEGGVMGLSKRKGSECWQMIFFLESRRVRQSTGTANRRLALKIYDETKAKAVTGAYRSPSELRTEMTVSELVDEFLAKHCRIEKRSWKRDETIGRMFKAHFGNVPISRIRPYDILAWRAKRHNAVTRTGTLISVAALNRELSFLKTMLRLAVDWGLLNENPAKTIKKLKGEQKRLQILTRDKLHRLIDRSRPSLKPIIVVAATTGMRVSEILNLKWKDVDFANGFIRVQMSKNSDPRNVPFDSLTEEMLRELKKGRRHEDYVFARKNGDRILSVREAFKAACKRAGITNFRFHDLRHTAASFFAAGGCDIVTLQHILGHKTLAMTQRYAHLVPGRYDKTREIMAGLWEPSSGEVGATKQPQYVVPKNLTSVSH